jgi:hypothetical protein
MDPTADGTGQSVFDMNPGSRMPKPTNKRMSYTCSVRSKNSKSSHCLRFFFGITRFIPIQRKEVTLSQMG